VIDGEAVILGVDGFPDFNALHSRKRDDEVQLYAFDILALDGEDLRALPLSLRKTNLARLLARRPDGIFVAPFEQGAKTVDVAKIVGQTKSAPKLASTKHCQYRESRKCST
jgi:ATP-dependent DNA ligase